MASEKQKDEEKHKDKETRAPPKLKNAGRFLCTVCEAQLSKVRIRDMITELKTRLHRSAIGRFFG